MKANCPVCGKTQEADSLDNLKKLIKNCCKRGRVVKHVREVFYDGPRFTLPFEAVFHRSVASQNKSTYTHWTVYNRDKKDWLRQVRQVFGAYEGINLWWSSWSITREYHYPNRRMDYANFVGGCKPLIDALIICRVIKDDSDPHFLCSYEQKLGEATRTILTLKEFRDDDKT